MTNPHDRSLDPFSARSLLRRAVEARANAYAPYSGFPVGAALLAADGTVYEGVNVENASYGLTTCAEQGAVAHATARGARDFQAIAIVGPEDEIPCPPCGRCRQVLHEADPRMLVVMTDAGGEPLIRPLAELLPGAFGPERLG